jgi:hypothetical protein
MNEKQLRQLIMLGLAGAAIYYLFFRAKNAEAFPASITVTPENPGLLTSFPSSVIVTPENPGLISQPQPTGFQPGWLTQGAFAMNGVPHGSMHGW